MVTYKKCMNLLVMSLLSCLSVQAMQPVLPPPGFAVVAPMQNYTQLPSVSVASEHGIPMLEEEIASCDALNNDTYVFYKTSFGQLSELSKDYYIKSIFRCSYDDIKSVYAWTQASYAAWCYIEGAFTSTQKEILAACFNNPSILKKWLHQGMGNKELIAKNGNCYYMNSFNGKYYAQNDSVFMSMNTIYKSALNKKLRYGCMYRVGSISHLYAAMDRVLHGGKAWLDRFDNILDTVARKCCNGSRASIILNISHEKYYHDIFIGMEKKGANTYTFSVRDGLESEFVESYFPVLQSLGNFLRAYDKKQNPSEQALAVQTASSELDDVVNQQKVEKLEVSPTGISQLFELNESYGDGMADYEYDFAGVLNNSGAFSDDAQAGGDVFASILRGSGAFDDEEDYK